MLEDGTGSTSPQRRSMSSPYNRLALCSSFCGSTRWGAPTSCTYTRSFGNRSTSEPEAPA